MSETENLDKDQAIEKSISSFENLRVVSKVTAIVTIVGFALSLLSGLAVGGGIFAAISSGEFDFDVEDDTTDSLIDEDGNIDEEEFEDYFNSLLNE